MHKIIRLEPDESDRMRSTSTLKTTSLSALEAQRAKIIR